jgi:iron-sulfur cluster repair protein YtfE (RIC family)
MVGWLIKIGTKLFQGHVQTKNLSALIAKAEEEYQRPLLASFSGLERFDAAVRLLDATLIRRLAGRPAPAARGEAVDLYLHRNYEEYQMSQEDLRTIHATRAEVVALGIALKEIALTLDREIEAFRSAGVDEACEQRRALETHVKQSRAQLDRAAAQVNEQLNATARHLEDELASRVETSFRLLQGNVNRRFSQAEASFLQRLTELARGAREHIQQEMRERIEALSQAVAATLEQTRGEQRSELERMAERLSLMEAGQRSFFETLEKKMSVNRRWVYASLLASAAAFLLRAALV